MTKMEGVRAAARPPARQRDPERDCNLRRRRDLHALFGRSACRDIPELHRATARRRVGGDRSPDTREPRGSGPSGRRVLIPRFVASVGKHVRYMFSPMPFESITLKPRYALRIDDFSDADLLCVHCEGCGKDWRIAKALLMSLYPLHKRVLDIGEGFLCRRCGSKICNWHMERAVPPRV